jgi:hypothetical protein
MTSKGESPRERPRPRPRPRPRQKKIKLVNEVMPLLTSSPSSPRLRMDPTKGSVNMHALRENRHREETRSNQVCGMLMPPQFVTTYRKTGTRNRDCTHLHATPKASARYFNLAFTPTGLFKYDQAQMPTPQKTRWPSLPSGCLKFDLGR